MLTISALTARGCGNHSAHSSSRFAPQDPIDAFNLNNNNNCSTSHNNAKDTFVPNCKD
jgi:hypothetical protein